VNAIDISRAIKAPFADKEWVGKTLLGIVWTLLVVTLPAVAGAQVEYIRRTASGNEELPDWSDFGEKWISGILVGVAGFIYFLPLIVVAIAMLVPTALVLWAGDEKAAPFGALVVGLFIAGALLYAVVVTLFFYAALTHYAVTGRFGAFFEFGEIARRLRTGGYFTAWLFAWVIGAVSSIASSAAGRTFVLSIIVPGISYLSLMMTAHLLGQYASQAYATPTVPAESGGPIVQ
jgi:hypothetical protein